MPLTIPEVKRIARLARIAVADDEAEHAAGQLSGIFALIEEMQKVDTQGVAPMAHALDVSLRMRPDAVTEADLHMAFQAVAPQVEADLYLVPKVIE